MESQCGDELESNNNVDDSIRIDSEGVVVFIFIKHQYLTTKFNSSTVQTR